MDAATRSYLRAEIDRRRREQVGATSGALKSKVYGRCPAVLGVFSRRAGEPCGSPAESSGYCRLHERMREPARA